MSAYTARWLAETHPHTTPHVLVPCGVDLEALDRTTPYDPRPFRVLAVGRLVPKKGFDDLLRAVARLVRDGTAVAVTLVGDGPLRPDLQALAGELGILDYVDLTGSVPPAAVRRALEDTTLLCAPCVVAETGDRDSQPVVVKEAMAMQVPVVATREVGLPEMVVDGITGRLVPPRDPEALARALAELAAAPDACVRMGRAGREHVAAHFGLDTTIPALLRGWGLHD